MRKNGLWKSYDKWPGIAAAIWGPPAVRGHEGESGVAEAGNASFYMVTPGWRCEQHPVYGPHGLGESMTPLNLGRVLLGIPTSAPSPCATMG